VPAFTNVAFTSITVQFVDPNNPAGTTYVVDLSTDDFVSVLETTTTTSLTLTFGTNGIGGGLDPNTTHYFRAKAVNHNLIHSSYTTLGSTSTLANPPDSTDFLNIYVSSIGVQWALPTGTVQSFLVEASSTDFDGTGTVHSSATTSGLESQLTVRNPALDPNTTYYFRLGSKNHNQIFTFTTLHGTSTLANLVSAPVIFEVIATSVTVNWAVPAGGSEGYELQASTSDNFTGQILSSVTTSVAVTTLTVEGLSSDTTYYLRVGAINLNLVRNYIFAGSTTTLTLTDVDPPTAVGNLTASTDTATSVILRWSAPSDPTDNPLSGNYAIQYATWTGVTWSTTSAQVVFSTSGVNPGDPQARVVGSLNSNTTYFFKLWTSDLKPNWSGESNQAEETVLAVLLQNTGFDVVNQSSAAVFFDQLPTSPLSASASGYILQASTASNFSGTVHVASTTNLSNSTLTVVSLSANSTYYFRAGSINQKGATNYAAVIATSTLANPPVQLSADFLNINVSSITAQWAAFPNPPPISATSEGYRLEASSTNFDGTGTITSSVTANVALSTLTVFSLDPNTTYYFRVGSLNWNDVPNYTTLSATSTLANGPTPLNLTNIFVSSASFSWSAPAGGAEGYRIEASSTNFDGTGTDRSSTTNSGAVTSLSVLNLLSNTTYTFRIGALNWNGTINFGDSLSTATLANKPTALAFDFLEANTSSITVQWAALPPSPPDDITSEGYRLDASSTNFDGTGTITSSVTANVALSTLTIFSLDPNTTYYFRVGSLNWNDVPNYTTLSATSTLANIPLSDVSTFTFVGVSSITTQWLANSNPPNTRYTLELSTDSSFATAVHSSDTTSVSATIDTLDPDSTYYAQVSAFNHNNVRTVYLLLNSTVTLTSQPGTVSPTYDPVEITSFTVHYSSGTPPNPAGTTYVVETSSQADYSNAISSETTALSAGFINLNINTTYYSRLRARNNSGVYSDYTILETTATRAVGPGPIVSTYTGVTSKAFTLNWTSGTISGGFNPAETTYHAQISEVSNFATITAEAFTTNLIRNFSGLVSDTIYYARVRAINLQGIATSFTDYGSTRTVASALPVFVGGTAEVINSAGTYIDISQYTNTLTPDVRVNVQSNQLPGLSVTDTPSMMAIWHLDASDTTLDSSLHNNNLTINGAPTSAAGQLNEALNFDGSADYLVTLDVFPWRSDAANNILTMELWFKAGASEDTGYLIQTADSNTGGGGVAHDGELTWLNSGNLKFNIIDKNTYAEASSAYDDGAWHYVAAVIDTSGIYLYVDGSLDGSNTTVTNADANTYASGADYIWVGAGAKAAAGEGNGSLFFGGVIDEVRVSTVALSLSEIQENYGLGLKGHGFGAPEVDYSTQTGTDFTWVRLSTADISITGTNGTLVAETFTAQNLQLLETTSPGANTNQIKFFATELGSGLTTAQYTILVDTNPPTNNGLASLTSPTTKGITVNFNTGSDSLSGLPATPYVIQAATNSIFDVVDSSSDFVSGTSFAFTDLDAHTTYYFRMRVRDNAGNESAFSSNLATATLALPVDSTAVQDVYSSSITIQWAPRPATPSSATTAGYLVEGSSTNFGGGTIYSTSTAVVSVGSLTVTGLSENTTYFFRVGTLNHQQIATYVTVDSTSTLVLAPGQGAPNITSVDYSSITVQWTDGGNPANTQYVAEVSTNNFTTLWASSQTINISVTFGTGGTGNPLDLNTTHYFRVRALNQGGVPSANTVLGSTSTLAVSPASTVPAFTNVAFTSITVQFVDPNNPAGTTYVVDLSTDDFVSVLQTTTTTSLTLTFGSNGIGSPLDTNTTHYVRAKAVNHNLVHSSYTTLGSTSTLANPPDSPDFLNIYVSSIGVQWTLPTGTVQSFLVEASSTDFDGTGTIHSSATTSGLESQLTVRNPALDPNTTYYFRLGSKNHNQVFTFTTLHGTSTLTNLVSAPTIFETIATSVTVNWSIPAGGSEGYELQASTSDNFTGLILSSVTTSVAVTTLTVEGLSSDTTYYLRVGAINLNTVRHYISAGSTQTLSLSDVDPPTAVGNLTASTDTATSIILRWSAPSDPTDNPLSGNYAIQYATWTGVTWSTTSAQVIFSTSGVNPGDAQARVVGGLNSNTTYFFKLWTSDLKPNWSGESNQAEETVLAVLLQNSGFDEVNQSSAAVFFDQLPTSPLSASASGYILQASTASNFTGTVHVASTTNLSNSTLTVVSLSANSTYYFRAGSINQKGATNYAAVIATSTLANQPVQLSADFLNIYVSSITAQWVAFPNPPPINATSEGYRLEASSTNFDGTGTITSSVTANVALSTLTVFSLDPNTTYYFRVGSLNWNNVPNYTTLSATSTLANGPTPLNLTNIFVSSASFSWSAPAGGAEGYRIEASSTNFDGTGTDRSSTTNSGAITSLSVLNLLSNTTYTFRIGALNWNGTVNFGDSLSTATLANKATALSFDFIDANTSSITVQWAALPPSPPDDITSEGYRLEASSTNFDGTGTVYSSSTADVALSTLTVFSLDPNTTYYFRVGSLNWNDVPNYTTLSATSTLVNPPLSEVSTFTFVGISSITTQWLANSNPPNTRYTLELSTDSSFATAVHSSDTTNVSATIETLDPDSTYYAQVSAFNHNNVRTVYLLLNSTVTLTSQPGTVSPTYDPVDITSFTVHYSSGTPPNPAGTTYFVETSSQADYSNAISSETTTLSAEFINLNINTTYYTRLRARNNAGTYSDYTILETTATHAVDPGPIVSTYTNVTSKAFTLNWTSGTASGGYNPSSTTYHAQISLVSNFATITDEIFTDALTRTFSGLISDTIYFARVKAINHQGIAVGKPLCGDGADTDKGERGDL